MSHIDELRRVIVREFRNVAHSAADYDFDAADAILTATYPPLCRTCRGLGCTCPGYCERADDHVCPDCPTIAQLLAWGIAVATAEMVDKRRPELFAPAFYDGYNSRLEVLRAVKP